MASTDYVHVVNRPTCPPLTIARLLLQCCDNVRAMSPTIRENICNVSAMSVQCLGYRVRDLYIGARAMCYYVCTMYV